MNAMCGTKDYRAPVGRTTRLIAPSPSPLGWVEGSRAFGPERNLAGTRNLVIGGSA